jgi:outer membrane protein assembly factor BamD
MKLCRCGLISLCLLIALLCAPRCMANEAANQAAAKEMVIANYYMSKHDYTAAINRLKTIATQYPGSPLADEAFARLTQTYLALTEVPSMENSRRQFLASEAQTAAAVLDRQFPASHFSVEAHNALKAAGLDPVENEKSWISRASK